MYLNTLYIVGLSIFNSNVGTPKLKEGQKVKMKVGYLEAIIFVTVITYNHIQGS